MENSVIDKICCWAAEEGEGFVVFVDFVTGDFSLDDFGENAAHIIPFWRLF